MKKKELKKIALLTKILENIKIQTKQINVKKKLKYKYTCIYR